MNARRLTAVLASALLLWGSAYAQQQPDTANVPESTGATAPGVVIVELGGPSAQPTPEETLAMQMLLLQLLMMQSEAAPSAGDVQIVAPSPTGIGI